jgi:aminoglycoside phosphotransferase (APT) family kinase protein
MERFEGETIARRTLREDRHAEARPRVAAQCGTFLATLHALARRAIEGADGS